MQGNLFSRIGIVMMWATALGGCNFFKMIDPPSGDAQLLSAARACFDQGDFTCASRYYGMVSSSNSDQALSETAFELLNQNGVTAVTFMNAAVAGGSSAGALVTNLAGSLTGGAGETLRLALFRAYKTAAGIRDSSTQGLVVFITSMSLLAEILAEDATTQGTFKKSDFVLTPSSCTSILTVVPCGPPAADKLIDGGSAITLSTATESDMSGSPSLRMIDAAINEILRGVNQMGSTAKLGTASGSFASELIAAAAGNIGTPAGSPVYRFTLLRLDVGAN